MSLTSKQIYIFFIFLYIVVIIILAISTIFLSFNSNINNNFNSIATLFGILIGCLMSGFIGYFLDIFREIRKIKHISKVFQYEIDILYKDHLIAIINDPIPSNNGERYNRIFRPVITETSAFFRLKDEIVAFDLLTINLLFNFYSFLQVAEECRTGLEYQQKEKKELIFSDFFAYEIRDYNKSIEKANNSLNDLIPRLKNISDGGTFYILMNVYF